MTRPRRDHHLTRTELLDAALGIVDDEGLAALTMRRLADAVGVEPMSLYHHVPSKEALLDATVGRMRSEMRLAEPMPETWPEILETIFVEYRRVLVAHPNLLPLASRRTDTASTSGLEFLVDQGVEPDAAVELYQSLVAYTIGYSTLSAPTATADWSSLPPELAERVRDWRESTFRRGLRSIMGGFAPLDEAAADRPAGAPAGEPRKSKKKGAKKR
jgi:TetR/AcrR family tetracycline transcriptional repressor